MVRFSDLLYETFDGNRLRLELWVILYQKHIVFVFDKIVLKPSITDSLKYEKGHEDSKYYNKNYNNLRRRGIL